MANQFPLILKLKTKHSPMPVNKKSNSKGMMATALYGNPG
jgi:hypothetical protein